MTDFTVRVPAWGHGPAAGESASAPDPVTAARQWAQWKLHQGRVFDRLDIVLVDPTGWKTYLTIRSGIPPQVTKRLATEAERSAWRRRW